MVYENRFKGLFVSAIFTVRGTCDATELTIELYHVPIHYIYNDAKMCTFLYYILIKKKQ